MCYRIFNLPLAFYSLLLFAILIIPQKAKAQEWSEPINITSQGYVKYINQADMIIDNNGVLHIVWVERLRIQQIPYWYILNQQTKGRIGQNL